MRSSCPSSQVTTSLASSARLGDYNALVSGVSELGGNPNPAPPAPTQTALVKCGASLAVTCSFAVPPPACPQQRLPNHVDRRLPTGVLQQQHHSPERFLLQPVQRQLGGYHHEPSQWLYGCDLCEWPSDAEQFRHRDGCLQLWVNPSTNDHMTLASPGLPWAQQRAYVQKE